MSSQPRSADPRQGRLRLPRLASVSFVRSTLVASFVVMLWLLPHRLSSVLEQMDLYSIVPSLNNETATEQALLRSTNDRQTRILVAYSGPTTLDTSGNSQRKRKNELYIRNFEYFLRKGGVDCATQDTVLVLTEPVAAAYRQEVLELNATCRAEHGHHLYVLIREDKCRDLESARIVLYGGQVNVTSYDYFIFVNCGLSGPSTASLTHPWTWNFTSKISETVKLVGLTHHCLGGAHIQSMVYCLDRVGLDIVMKSGAVFDCGRDVGQSVIIGRYEVGMSKHMLGAGYGIADLLRNATIMPGNQIAFCRDQNLYPHKLKDLWMKQRLVSYFGRVPHLNETMFFKTSRLLPDEIAHEIGYTGRVNWGW